MQPLFFIPAPRQGYPRRMANTIPYLREKIIIQEETHHESYAC